MAYLQIKHHASDLMHLHFPLLIVSLFCFILKYSLNRIPYQFQVYNCASTFIYITNDHHNQFSNHLSPYKVTRILLTVFLYFTLDPHDQLILQLWVYTSYTPPISPKSSDCLFCNHQLFCESFSVLFVLYFRFHILVRSHGICLSLVLFHLT